MLPFVIKWFGKGRLHRHKKKQLPLTALQGTLLALAIAILVGLVFLLVIYLDLPRWTD